MDNSKLIIITRYASLKEVDSRVQKIRNIGTLKDRGFLEFHSGQLMEIEMPDNAEIVFVWDRDSDEISDVDRQEWWQNTFLPMKKADKKWYVVHHSKGIKPDETSSIFCRPGAHIPGDKVYGKVASILLDSADNKKERIIKVVFTPPLEAVLEFLHGCSEKQPDVEAFQKLKDIEIDTSVLQELDSKSYDNEYIENLRNKLLELVK